jgi:PAS domain S-box-containing protein
MLLNFTPWVIVLGGILAFAITMALLLTYFQQIRNALLQSEERFRAISTYAYDWEIWLGTNGQPLWVNAAANRMTGISSEEALAMHDYPLPLIVKEDQAAVRAALALVADGGIVDDQLFRLRRRGDSSVWASLSAQQIFARNGSLLGTRLSIRDVSLLIRYQEEMERKRSLLQTILDTVPAPIFYKDADGLYLGCNTAFERYLGKCRSEVIGKSVFDIAPPDLAQIYDNADRELLQQGGTQSYETQVVFADGSRHDVLFSKAVFARQDHAPDGLVGAMLDITARKQAERALQESEARHKELFHEFETIFNGIPDSLTVWSSEMQVLWANASSAGQHAQVVGKSCHELCAIDFAHQEDCEVRRAFASGELEEGIHQARDGRTWGIKAFPLRNAAGTVDRVIRLASDLTERMILREEAARAAHLAALGELAAGMAHEINNPTSLILLEMPILQEVFRDSSEILEEHFRIYGDFTCGGLRYSKMRSQVPAMIAEILDSAERIRQIVEELRDFSHPTEANQFKAVDLNAAVRKALNLVGNQIKKATDRFSVTYAPTAPRSLGSLQRLEQVVINLVINACQALPDRERRLTVEIDSWPERRRNVIRVADSGIGILPDHLKLITDPFFTTRRAVGGTGLGLSVSTRIIEEHGGTLHFASELGVGTTVTIELPMLEAEEQP